MNRIGLVSPRRGRGWLALVGLVALGGILGRAAGVGAAPPPNDNCASAQAIASSPFSQVVETDEATQEPGDPVLSCLPGERGSNTVWYAYTPPASGSVFISCGGYGAVVAAYTGSCASPVAVECNPACEVELQVTQGQRILIEVASVIPGGGQLSFDLIACVDGDSDGVDDCFDNCPTVFNPDQDDRDFDEIGTACDDCPDDESNLCNVCVVNPVQGSLRIALVPSATGGRGLGEGEVLLCAGRAFEELPLEALTAANLARFDTVALIQACDVNTVLTAQQKADLLAFVGAGHKLIIWDSECDEPVPDYSWLPFPFTSSNPGAQGAPAACEDLTIVEENSLSCTSPGQPCFVDTCTIGPETDAVGDMNVMITGVAGWCIDMVGTNVLGTTGPVQAYAQLGKGLVIWNGLDMDDMPGHPELTRIWALNLQQPFNPAAGLPCIPVNGPGPSIEVTLEPVNALQNIPFTSHAVMATVADASTAPATPLPGVQVNFTVTGPNATSGTTTTDAAGRAAFNYTGTQLGTDTIVAAASVEGATRTSNGASKSWGPIKLEPLSATNPIGTNHTLTATAVDLSQNPPPPLVGLPVEFRVNGRSVGSAVTDASGKATFTYSSEGPRLDSAIALVLPPGDTRQRPSNVVTKKWAQLLLEPQSAVNPVRTPHTVTATAFNRTGSRLTGVQLCFAVSGANPGSGCGMSDANGEARFTYTGAAIGDDTIFASFTDPLISHQVTSDPAFKKWRRPQSVCGNGAVEPDEECDDGNTVDGDCCSSVCRSAPSTTTCEDDNACTDADVCQAGVCQGAEMCRVELACPGVQFPAACEVTVSAKKPTVAVTIEGQKGSKCRAVLFEVQDATAVTTAPEAALAATDAQRARAGTTPRRLSKLARGKIRPNGQLVLKLKLNKIGRQLLGQRASLRARAEVTIKERARKKQQAHPARLLQRLITLVRR